MEQIKVLKLDVEKSAKQTNYPIDKINNVNNVNEKRCR